MSDSSQTKKNAKKQKKHSEKKTDYWDRLENESLTPRYPQVGESKFTSFLGKIGMGLAFSFIPAFMFALINEENLFYSWGITLLMVSGIYFVIAAWKDLSRTSVRKSYKNYRERLELTQKHEDKFQFSLGFLQFGQTLEDIGAAICLLSIGAMMLSIA
ncbi:MAG: hypothetical protein ACW98F_11170 [Candidatus Hodarchaeales archaeon]|jgi:Na+/melibiose symporter-like transporter